MTGQGNVLRYAGKAGERRQKLGKTGKIIGTKIGNQRNRRDSISAVGAENFCGCRAQGFVVSADRRYKAVLPPAIFIAQIPESG